MRVLERSVVESVPIHEDIKRQSGDFKNTLKITSKVFAIWVGVIYLLSLIILCPLWIRQERIWIFRCPTAL